MFLLAQAKAMDHPTKPSTMTFAERICLGRKYMSRAKVYRATAAFKFVLRLSPFRILIPTQSLEDDKCKDRVDVEYESCLVHGSWKHGLAVYGEGNPMLPHDTEYDISYVLGEPWWEPPDVSEDYSLPLFGVKPWRFEAVCKCGVVSFRPRPPTVQGIPQMDFVPRETMVV